MNIKLPAAVTTRFARQILVAQKNSPTILFVAGTIGVVATTVAACHATLKLDEEVLTVVETKSRRAKDLRDDESTLYSALDYKKDMSTLYIQSGVKIVKLYGPTLILGAVSIGALTGAHCVLSRRNVALTAAYATVEKAFNEYRSRVIDEIGTDKERDIYYSAETVEVVEESKNGPKNKLTKRVGPEGASMYARFFDEYSRNWSKTSEYNFLFLKCQQNYANDLLKARGHLFLNEVYDMLGLERTQAGSVVGWVISKDSDNFVDFGIFDGDNPRVRDFVNGREGSVLIDFNVDGIIYDKI